MGMFVKRKPDWTRQPNRVIDIKSEYMGVCAFAYNVCNPRAYSVGKHFGKLLTVSYLALKRGADGIGATSTDNSNAACYSTSTDTPIVTSTGDGKGALSLVAVCQPQSQSGRKTIFIYMQAANLYVIANGYLAEGAGAFTDSAGTLWVGFYSGDAAAGRGIRVDGVVDGSVLRILFSRNAVGYMELWINGTLRGTNNQPSYINGIYTVGTASQIGINGRPDSAGAASNTHIVSTVAVFNTDFDVTTRKELSKNPWQIYTPVGGEVPLQLGTEESGVIIDTTPAQAVGTGLQTTVTSEITLTTAIAQALTSGLPVSVSSDITLSCALAAGIATGMQAGVSTDITVSTGAGSGEATGIAVTITASEDSIQCTPAFGVATGRNAVVTSEIEIDAAVGAGAGSGLTSVISTDQTVSCSLAAVSASGLGANVISNISIACGYAHGSGYGLPVSISTVEDIPLTEAQLDQALAFIKSDPMVLTIPKYIALRDMLNS